MIAVLSPAKSLDFEEQFNVSSSKYRFTQESLELIDVLKQKSEDDLINLMSISEQLAQINVDRFNNFKQRTPTYAKQAVLAFQGDVYQGLKAFELGEEELEYAQSHIRILSGLYGLLRPLDLIQPYRLEMGTKLEVNGHKNLYSFWGDKVAELLIKDLRGHQDKLILNLASNEYFKVLKRPIIKEKAKVVDVDFKDQKNGQYKVISFFAKKARGLMARYIVDKQIDDVEELKSFNEEGYYFDAENSTAKKLCFKRDEI